VLDESEERPVQGFKQQCLNHDQARDKSCCYVSYVFMWM